MSQIDYFFSTLSPWTYLVGSRLEEIAARHGATITYKPCDIVTLFTRTGGLTLPQRHESRRAYRLQELRRQSKKAGLPITINPAYWPMNPAPSCYAIIAAQTAGGGDLGGFVRGCLAATWAQDRNLADEGVVRDLLAAHGFDPAIADKGMFAAAETYARNLEEAVERGVFGAPFFVVGEEKFWGQDRLDDLDMFLAGDL